MKRIVYTTKGNTRELKQIDEGLAFKLQSGNNDLSLSKHLGSSFGNKWISHQQIQAFCRAGWIFMEPNILFRSLLNNGSMPEGIEDMGNIYVDSNDQLKISTDQISIHFDPYMSYDKCLRRIKEFELTLITVLPYGKNLFTVKSNNKTNALEKCIDINRHHDVRYAEPNFVQLIPGSSYLQG